MSGKIISFLLGSAVSGGLSTVASCLAIDEHDDTTIGATITMSIASALALDSINELKSSDIMEQYIESLSEEQLAELSEKIEVKEKNFVVETNTNDRDVVVKVKSNSGKRV